ncbi:MAG TPA: hypothetical protein VG710_06180 [Opitutus sp.]|nr:hypothetical protein [Opitutus sp.]
MRTRLGATERWVSGTRLVGVGAIAADLSLIAWLLQGPKSPLQFPGGTTTAVEAVVMLAIYAVAFAVLPGRLGIHRDLVLRLGGAAGMLAGVLQVGHMALENFGSRVGENALVTLGFMLAAFAIWALAGYRASRTDGAVATGIATACASAMWSMVVAVTFGLALTKAGVPSAGYVATWQEFKQSGWADPRAFAITNGLDAAFGHLAVGVVLGCIFGFFGGVVGSVAARRAR